MLARARQQSSSESTMTRAARRSPTALPRSTTLSKTERRDFWRAMTSKEPLVSMREREASMRRCARASARDPARACTVCQADTCECSRGSSSATPASEADATSLAQPSASARGSIAKAARLHCLLMAIRDLREPAAQCCEARWRDLSRARARADEAYKGLGVLAPVSPEARACTSSRSSLLPATQVAPDSRAPAWVSRAALSCLSAKLATAHAAVWRWYAVVRRVDVIAGPAAMKPWCCCTIREELPPLAAARGGAGSVPSLVRTRFKQSKSTQG
mmetsp:Transcript_4244/g.11980  ORF Transcript_4244/g.11980 Transcript_4244/m.11980 type:complete len:275 (+) Transcript_4244:487-1311(+)